MSKGSSQRPTDSKAYSDNWDKIFSKPKAQNAPEKKKQIKKIGTNCA